MSQKNIGQESKYHWTALMWEGLNKTALSRHITLAIIHYSVNIKEQAEAERFAKKVLPILKEEKTDKEAITRLREIGVEL